MAPCKALFLLNFFCFISSVSFSRALHQQQHFQVFDVAASIAKTRKLFSQKAPQQHEHVAMPADASTNSSFVLSVSLHPRLSITKQLHTSYRNLTLSRLARDSVRVESIYTRLQLEPIEESFRPSDLESPVTSGLTQGSGEYFARLGVGQPAQSYYLVIDTGSDVSWIQCEPCSICYKQSDPVFDPSGSSSYHPLQCASTQCSSLRVSGCGSAGCLYRVSYGDGSYTTGDLATETLTFGNSGRLDNVAIGCGHENDGLFIGSAGILGIGGGPLSLPSQIKASSFSYCLVNRDSTASSTLEFNSAPPGDSVVTSLIRNPRYDTFFYVDLVGISVAGEKLPIPESAFQVDGSGQGGVVVDSGTTVTRLSMEAYDPLRDTFLQYTQNLPKSEGEVLLDTCYDLSSMSRVSVPTVAFLFAGEKTLTLNVENVLLPVDDNGKFCLAFATSRQSLNIIGNVQQQGTRVNYDLANRQIAFSQNKC